MLNNYSHKSIFNLSLSLILIFASFVSISFGIWNTGVPFGDECGYIEEARKLNNSGSYSSNLYILTYQAIFKFTKATPVYAHIFLRSVSSFVSTILLYTLLKVIRTKLNEMLIIFICIFWMNCYVNMPLVQYGNINLFTLNIALAGLIPLIRKQSANLFLTCLSATLLCAKIRPEYWIAVVLITAYTFYLKWKQIFILSNEFIVSNLKSIKTGLIIFILTCIFLFSGKGDKRNFDQYLLLGLSQCYTFLYAKLNPEMKMNTMIEYSSLIDEVFDKPTGFIDVAIKNPFEMLNYLMMNGFINSLLLIPSLLYHRPIFPPSLVSKSTELLIILAIPIIESLLLFYRVIRNISFHKILNLNISKLLKYFDDFIFIRFDINVLFILSLVSIVSIFLLIPDPRYWITCMPLLLFWLVWAFSRTLHRFKNKSLIFILIVALSMWMSRPLFLSKDDNRNLIEMIINYNKKLDIQCPVVAGHTSVGTYVFKSFKPMSINQMTPETFINSNFDYFIFDKTIVESQFWERNKELLTKFVQSPESFGYSLIYISQQKGEFIAAYGREIDTK